MYSMVASPDTLQLVKQAQVGNTEAFTALVQSYEPEIYRYLVGMLGDRDEAHDFVQQVFLKARLNLATLQSVTCFRTWLYTIARKLIFDHWRRRKGYCQSREHLEVDNLSMRIPGPEEQAMKMELIHLALGELAPKLRQCLLLRLESGFSPREIAEMVGIGESSVGTYISTARKQFCAIYERLENEQWIEVRVDS